MLNLLYKYCRHAIEASQMELQNVGIENINALQISKYKNVQF